jgi:hypothetical protein
LKQPSDFNENAWFEISNTPQKILTLKASVFIHPNEGEEKYWRGEVMFLFFYF